MAKVTDHFKQEKQGLPRQGARGKKPEPQQSLGCTAAEATEDFDISEQERVLRAFDLATQYGPCTGMTRLERWDRAQKFGLNPPVEICELLTGPQGENCNKPIWDGRI